MLSPPAEQQQLLLKTLESMPSAEHERFLGETLHPLVQVHILTIYRSISFYLSIDLSLSTYLSIYLLICLSIYLSIYLSIHLSIHGARLGGGLLLLGFLLLGLLLLLLLGLGLG